jgi:hypothetical protein
MCGLGTPPNDRPRGPTAAEPLGLHFLDDYCNDATWKATQGTIEEWEEMGLPSDGSLEEKARYGFSQLFLIAQYARNNGMPMKLDGFRLLDKPSSVR